MKDMKQEGKNRNASKDRKSLGQEINYSSTPKILSSSLGLEIQGLYKITF